MCGLLGYLGEKNTDKFEKGFLALKHRGPDGSSTVSLDKVILGHHRLKIIDVSEAANQPFVYQNRYYLVFNGEIYNYIELRQELKTAGYNFTTDSDTEVLLYSILHWGVKAFNKFNGMWALGLWDNETKELLLSRDRVGKKPLFYSTQNNEFVFGSEMKGIYPFLNDVRFNETVLKKAQHNFFSYESSEDCLIEGINKLQAGSYAIYKNNKLSIHKYYDLINEVKPFEGNYNEQKEAFKELFIDACKIRARSDVVISTALSGGIDSTVVTAVLHNLKKENKINPHILQNPFVAIYPNSALNEQAYAEEVAKHLNIKANLISVNPLEDIDNIFRYAYLFEEYNPTFPLPFIKLYQSVKKTGISVTIDGHGSDELFGGYPFGVYEMVKKHPFNPIKAFSYYNTILSASTPKSKLISIKEFTKLYLSSFDKNIFDKKNELWDGLNNTCYDYTFNSILPTILRNFDRYSMINGIEIRMPFLDHRIINFAFSIPSSSKVKNGYLKYIVRDSFKDLMPYDIYARKRKIGWNAPFFEYMQGSLKPWIMDAINSKDFETSNYYNGKLYKEEIIKILNKNNISYHDGELVWRMLITYVTERSLNLYAK